MCMTNKLTEAQIMNERMLHADLNFNYKSFDTEHSLYNLVASGDLEGLTARQPSLQKKGLGKLSKNETRNILFHLIINTSNCARACISSGMREELAYTISDLYIQKADDAKTIEELEDINHEMIFDYTTRMKELQENESGYSSEISRAINYIDSNLHSPIRATNVADYLGISLSTFSNKFYACTGHKFNQFVESRRIQLAKRYLQFTDLSVCEIASNLAFCSQSYFNTRFKKCVGVTPLQFRGISVDDISNKLEYYLQDTE